MPFDIREASVLTGISHVMLKGFETEVLVYAQLEQFPLSNELIARMHNFELHLI